MPNPPKVRLRNYKDSDYPEVRKTIIECFGKGYSEEWDSRANLKGKIRKSPGSIIIAEVDGRIIGNVFVIDDHWAGLISRLAVRKKYRNHGIGLLLMREAERRLKRSGVKALTIFVNDGKEDLKSYYKKDGWTPTSAYRCFYKIVKNKKAA
ncbi:MAG: GNAT family N-acetyltransferase [Candidatus Micrarchaeota archaeon]|nr:GNAT family N-acetyltransferase [Candidatus Micrarchaeota archaeon]